MSRALLSFTLALGAMIVLQQIYYFSDMRDAVNQVYATGADIHPSLATGSNQIDTAIIISSSWIPTHPSISFIETSIASARKHLKGLSSSTPIIITVDQLPPPPKTPEDQVEARAMALDKYVHALFQRYLNETNVHIMPSMEHWHIGGNVHKALQLVEKHFPSVEFLYYMQHDFEFVHTIDHDALVNTMRNHTEVNYIRFKYKERETPFKCGQNTTNVSMIDIVTNDDANEIGSLNATDNEILIPRIWQTRKYSDNNHFVRFDWYLRHFVGAMEGDFKRPPEFPLQSLAVRECETLGLYTYGTPKRVEPPVLRHLDGRLSTS